MDSSPENIIKFSSTIFHKIQGISWSSKLYWNKLLPILFEGQLSRERIRLLAIQKEKYVEDEDQTTIIPSLALLKLIKQHAKDQFNLSEAKKINAKLEEIKTKYSINEEAILKQVSLFEDRLSGFDRRIRISIPTTIYPLAIDHFLRWLVLWSFPEFGDLFWMSNILAIPGLIFLYSWLRARQASSINNQLLSAYDTPVEFKIELRRNALQFTLMAIFLVLSMLVILNITDSDDTVLAIILTMIGYIIYYTLYFKHFSTARIDEKDLALQMESIGKANENLSPDENDEAIVDQISRIKSISGRLEAYVLESALFGALAFSGFLQIMAEGLVSFEQLENFALHAFSMFSGLVFLDASLIQNASAELTSKSDLFALISVETLVCSMLFLVVIASRLRYSDISDKVTRSLDLAKSYNEKEEGLLLKGHMSSDERTRMNTFNQKIQQQLKKVEAGLLEMQPITIFMRFFRNAGIATFIVILVSSALFISSFLSWLFAILGIATILYFNRKGLNSIFEKTLLALRWVFVRSGYIFLLGSIMAFVTGFFLRTLWKWYHTDIFLLFGFVFLAVYFFIWIVLIPHYDKHFEENISSNVEKSKGWSTIRFFWGLGVLLFVLGFGFRYTDLPGAGAIIGIGSTTMMVIFILIGPRLSRPKWAGTIMGIGMSFLINGIMFKLLRLPGSGVIVSIGLFIITVIVLMQGFMTKPKWIGMFVGVSLAILTMGIEFKFMHWPGGGLLATIGTILAIIAVVISSIKPLKKKFFHRVFSINSVVVIVAGLLSISGPSGAFENAYDNFTLRSEFLKKITDIHNDRYLIGDQLDQGHSPAEFTDLLSGYMNKVDWYIDYSKDIPFTDDRRNFINTNFNICLYILGNNEDPNALEWGYKLSRQANVMGEKEGYWDASHQNLSNRLENEPYWLVILEPLFLQKLGRTNEAKAAAEYILAHEQMEPGVIENEIKEYLPEVYPLIKIPLDFEPPR